MPTIVFWDSVKVQGQLETIPSLREMSVCLENQQAYRLCKEVNQILSEVWEWSL